MGRPVVVRALAAGGDFTVLSDTVAQRDASLPVDNLLAALRSQPLT
ncbi:MAG: hypothetical protein ACRDWN_05935 [Acidimicrobiales bacterium]